MPNSPLAPLAPTIHAAAPRASLARRIAGTIEVHLLSGNWEAAAHAFRCGHRDYLNELTSARASLSRTPEEWLDEPIAELNLPTRDLNCFESVGAETIADAIRAINSGHDVPNFGDECIAKFWRAIKRIGLGHMRNESLPSKKELLKQQQRRASGSVREKTNATKYNERRKLRDAQVRAGGLGGRAAFMRGPQEVIRKRETG